jgi:hypothetical protein
MLAKMREGVETLFRSARVEDDLDQSKEAIVLDDKFVLGGCHAMILSFILAA